VVAGDSLVVPAGAAFSLSNPGASVFEAVVVLPVGGQAVVGDEAPFTPPWAA
jgi:mannose-6-phosphate isomerase-like protein (cupin superfamily)